jgi:Zn-dependent peptidase ImmA (M78 family)/transcriptional regulator with XRE-family HTH domain
MPKINNLALTWARDSAGLSKEDAARKLNFRDAVRRTAVEKLEALENGEEYPSRSVLKKLSSAYRVPLLTFYLENIPTKGERGEDFRMLPEQFEARENLLLDSLLLNIKARQGILKQALIDEDEGLPLEFIGSFNTSSGSQVIAEGINSFLSFNLAQFRQKTSTEDSFKYLRRCAEDAGVFVLLQGNLGSHHTDISVDVFRGFALADPLAPFIVINNKDAKTAWSFTLLHELVHLALGKTGVSGLNADLRIEKLCNDVASEVLLPEKEFRTFVVDNDNVDETLNSILEYARERNLSASHVAYRLYKRGSISQHEWTQLKDHFGNIWSREKARLRQAQKEQDGGPDYYVLRRQSVGRGLLGRVQRYLHSGSLSTTKAARLLGVRSLKVHRLFDQ